MHERQWFVCFVLIFVISTGLVSKDDGTTCRQGIFQKVRKGRCSLANITSRHLVASMSDCGQRCIREDTCDAFNYRPPTSRNEPNCHFGKQLETCIQNDTEENDHAWTTFIIVPIKPPVCLTEKHPCVNGGECVGDPCKAENYRCVCPLTYAGTFCEQIKPFPSCKSVLETDSDASDGPYNIQVQTSLGYTTTYCQMTSLPGCSGGGWTLVMKIDGRKITFKYNSSYWSNYHTYNVNGGMTAFNDQETKLPTYWSVPFSEVCVGMKVGTDVKFVSISYTASSLYSLIADGKYRATTLGRDKWKSLIAGSSLQSNCNREGFNNYVASSIHTSARLGILANDQDDCASPDSFLGFGGKDNAMDCHRAQIVHNICGNFAYCSADNGDRDIKSMGYVLVR